MAPEVMQCLVGRLPPVRHAVLSGYTRHPVIGFVFPGIVLAKTPNPQQVAGLLYSDLTDYELEIMDWFEDVEYTRMDVKVSLQPPEPPVTGTTEDPKDTTTGRQVPTQVYVWTNPKEELDLTQEWDYERFCRENLAEYLLRTVEPSRLAFERQRHKQK